MKNCVCRFIVTSDLHFKSEREKEQERFEKGMKMAYDYARSQPYNKIDLFVADGDFADRGEEGQMLSVKAEMDECLEPGISKIMTLASHEFMSEGVEAAYEKLGRIFNLPSESHLVINGYHFIGVSCSERCRFNDEKKKFLAEELKKAAETDRRKPIFVFQHPHIQETVYGSHAWGEDELTSIMMDYPQIIDFSGHSHAPINDPRSIYQKHFTCFGTGSLSYFELDEFDLTTGTVPPDAKNCAQFLIGEIFDDNSVKIIPVDILSGRFFNDGAVIERPWDPDSFVYTDARADEEKTPVFPEGTRFDIEYSDGKMKVCFGQAINEPVRTNSYSLTIKNSEGLVFAQKKAASSYYIYDMPETISMEWDASYPAGEYTATVTANGYWKAKSEPISKKFTIK